MKKGVPYNQGKRSVNRKKKAKKKCFKFLIIIIILILFCLGYEFIVKNSTNNTNEENDVINTVQIEDENNIENNVDQNSSSEEIVDVDLPDKMGNYTVIGQLVIEKLGIEKAILNKTTDESLKLSVTKFYGPNMSINDVGNFCITGHNYKNMLQKVKDLEIGDTFYLINKEKKTKVTYKIFDIYSCNPTDLRCLDAVTKNEKEVTLITCNPGGVTRLIIKAKKA